MMAVHATCGSCGAIATSTRMAAERAAREALVLERRRNEETERARQTTSDCVAEAAVSPASGAAERPEPTSSESTAPSKKQWVHSAAIQAPASWLG